MKIERITLHHLRMPLRAPFETSFGRIDTRECILIQLHADGLIGLGECVADHEPGYSYETTGTAWHILEEFIVPALLKGEIRDAADCQVKMSGIRGHHLAKAGVEMAVWDLVGKRSGRSLRSLFGGSLVKVDVGVSIGLQESPTRLVAQVEKFMNEGYQRVKIKIKPGRDVQDTLSVRKAYPDLRLQVDANSAYTLDTANSLKPLDDMNLLMIEQPLFEDDIWDHARLQAQLQTPLCLDESITSARHARYAVEMSACRIINIKAGRVSGLREAIAVHDLCREHGIPVWCGGMLETGVGRASNLALASLPNFSLPGDISASERYYETDITRERFVLNDDSTITVPDQPGLGVTLDPSALIKFSLKEKVITPE
jgi:O-succinylbenzoate synthase